MKPAVPVVVTHLAERLRNEIVPQLAGFSASNVAMAAQMLDMVAQDWDRAAARLFAENADLRTLLAHGAALTGGKAPPLDPDTDLRISALEAANDALRRDLITLHAEIETRGGDDARALDAAIWDALRRSVERRRVASANF